MMLIVQRLKREDISALEEVYNKHFARVYSIAFKYVRDDYLASDLVHDVFIKLWKNREKLSEELTLDHQLFVITKGIVIDYLRKKVREEKLLYDYQTTLEEPEEDTKNDLRNSRLRKMYSIIETMPKRQQVVFKMIRFEGFTYDEVAERLNISKNTVSNHFTAAMKFLRKKIYFLFF